MQGCRSRVRNVWLKGARLGRFVVVCALPLLGGCLPGLNWGGDSDDRASLNESSEQTPALNRSSKTSLGLKIPSFGAAQLIPESGSSLFGLFGAAETKKPPQAAAPGWATVSATEAAGVYEPALLPAAQALDKYYAALAALSAGRRAQPVSIIHFGGDGIVNDRFAGPLREHILSRFGNAGRGLMLPGLYPLKGMKVERGGQWALASAAAGAPGPFGVTGVRVSSAASDAWLRFTSTEGALEWIDVAFMTGPGQGTAAVSVDGDVKLVPTNAPSTNQTSIRLTVKAKEIMIRPRGDGQITVLSVASGSRTPGILYTNAGLPGATAWTPEKWNADFAANDFRKLNPDLILIEYGTQEGFIDELDIAQYEARLRLVIAQMKTWAPHASVAVIGPPDAARLPAYAGTGGSQLCRALNPQELANYGQMLQRSDERLARWHAPPKLEAVRSAMRRAASSSGAFFWDWAKYMGGPCSVHAWTAFKPPLAAPDHMTLTEAGEERSARAFFAELTAGFEAYQRALVAKAQAALAVAPAPAQPALKPTKVSTKKPRKSEPVR
jgi:hypothetical protein